jgi:predicted NAD/FAD-binding protein
MHTIQNTRGISYAGAWMGYGFHEDGFTSGLRAALAIGDVKLPFEIRGPDRRVEALYMADIFDQLEYIRRVLSGMLFALLTWVGLFSA